MKDNRFFTLIAVIVMVALVVGTWFLGISPRLSEVATAEVDRALVEGQNMVHQAELTRLVALEDQLPALEKELAALHLAIPGSPDTSAFLRQLESITAATGVRFTSVSFSAIEPYEASVSEAAGAEGSEDLLVNPELASALGSVSGDNFLVVAVQFDLSGPYSAVMEVLSMLQEGDRFVLVHGVSIEEGLREAAEPVRAIFDGQLFILLDSSGVPAAVAPAA